MKNKESNSRITCSEARKFLKQFFTMKDFTTKEAQALYEKFAIHIFAKAVQVGVCTERLVGGCKKGCISEYRKAVAEMTEQQEKNDMPFWTNTNMRGYIASFHRKCTRQDI